MKSETQTKLSAEAEIQSRALLDEKLAFDAWLESYEDSVEARGERT